MRVVLESRYARTSVCLCVERRERKGHVDVGIEVHLCVCECVKFSGFCRVYVRHIRVYIYQTYVCVFQCVCLQIRTCIVRSSIISARFFCDRSFQLCVSVCVLTDTECVTH